MFRTSKTQGPFSFEIAAERILKGWKAAGQPIIANTLTEKNLTDVPKNNVCMPLIEKNSSMKNYHQAVPGPFHISSTDKLLQHAHELSKIAF